MRNFFSILLYIIAGIFLAAVVQLSFEVNTLNLGDITRITIYIVTILFATFLLLASLLYPHLDFYKPSYITLLTSMVVIFLSQINTYFVMKGIESSDINSTLIKSLNENDFEYNIAFGISISVIFILLTLYFYFQSKKSNTQITDTKDKKRAKKKRWLPFFISLIVVFCLIYGLGKLFMFYGIGNKYDTNATEYMHLIQKSIDTNESNEVIAMLATSGYDNYDDDKDEFIIYDNAVKKLFLKKTWKDKSSILSTKLWANIEQESNLTQESFNTFFEQLETLDSDAEDNSTTWGLVSRELASKYINYMEKQLEKIASSNIQVPLVMLYKKDGSTVEEMKLSRDYLVSEVYRRITNFCDDAENIYFDVEYYAKKAAESSPLNPSALFMYAYYSDDSNLVVDLLEDVLALTKVSDELLENEMFAVYNNLGYNISLSNQKSKYDDALKYLKKAYELNTDSIYSLATMSEIYMEREEYIKAYNSIKKETYIFFHSTDEELKEKESTYWAFVRGLISIAYDFKDYNTTQYVCNKYLEIYDTTYEDCQEYLEEIKKLSPTKSTKPIQSFWKLYTQPEMFQHKLTPEIKGTLGCGTVMKYGDSLKYKSTSQIQTGLLKKFSTLYSPHQVPQTLKELIKIEEKLGADSYTISFYLDPEPREAFFDGTFSYDDKALNKKVAKHFLPLAHIDGTGATAALWAIDGNKTDLENAPIVEFGSEGQIDIVAKNLKDFIYMLSFGIEPMDGGYSQFVSDNEENYRRENFEAYRRWLKETMNIEPVKDLEVWGTPKKLEALQKEAQELYRDKFFQWLYTLVPNNGTVEEGKQEADKFIVLVKEKKRLTALIDENATSEVYRLLARNEQGLNDIDRSLEENVSAYYKKSFERDNNISILSEWAMFLGRFTDKAEIKNDKDKAYLNIRFQEVYVELENEVKAKEHLKLGLDLYKKSAMQEDDVEKKMGFYEIIAEIYKDENKTDSAIEYYNKAIEVKADDVLWRKKYYYVDLAEIYEEQKEYALAAENYKKAVAIVKEKKDKAVYDYKIADNYKALGDYKQALYHARKSLVQAPNNTVLKDDAMELIADIKRLWHARK